MTIVGSFKTYVPDLDTFVVRGTLPVPMGHQYSYSRNCPFTLFDPEGNALLTQWDSVSKYPNGDVAVVKLSAKATRGSMEPGSEQHFTIKDLPSPSHAAKIDATLTDLMLKNGNVRLRVTDVHDNVYEESISYGPPEKSQGRSWRMHEIGPVTMTAEIGGWMRCKGEEPTELPYFGGLIWWMTARDDSSNVVELVLDWHNGGAPLPLADLYFKSVELVLPAGWNARSEWPEPLMGEPSTDGDEVVIPLILPRGDGKMHLLPQRQERIWRLYLHKNDDLDSVKEIASQRGWAVCDTGDDYWSWSNYETANYCVQRTLMPSLSHFDAAGELRGEKRSQYNELENGLPWYGFQGIGQMGPWNPAGVAYGGMTGGDEVYQWDGVRTLVTGEPDGLLLHRVKHRRYTDRAHAAFYDVDGMHVQQDRYLAPAGNAQWSMADNVFQVQSWPYQDEDHDAPWEFDQVNTVQVDYVRLRGLQPPYEGALKSYMPIDQQHQVRRTKDLKTLIWLDNDPVAKKHLAVQAELNRMAFAEYKWGRYADGLQQALSNPRKGGGWGRGHAWGLDCNVSYYAIASESERARWRAWMETTYKMLLNMQMSNGHWQRAFTGKIVTAPPFNGQYSVARINELLFSTHALRGLKRSVFEGVDDEKSIACDDMIRRAAIGLWTFFWSWKQDGSGHLYGGPWDRVAVGSLDPQDPAWSRHSQHPSEQWGATVDNYHVASLLAYALEPNIGTVLEKPTLDVIRVHLGGDPLTTIKSEGSKLMNSRAYLLALLQGM